MRDDTRGVTAVADAGQTAATTETNCFGCAPKNPIGLRLVFQEQGAGLTTRVKLGKDYESFPGIVHGGIVATVLDEILAQTVYRSGQVSAVTTALRVRYGQPMHVDTEYRASTEITGADAGSVRVSGRIELPNGDLVAAADGTFFLLTDDALHQKDRFPTRLTEALRDANRSVYQRT